MEKKDIVELKRQLKKLLMLEAFKKGEFILSSGKTSSYYLDGRIITLTPEGAYLVARIIIELIAGKRVDALGGPTIGADPILGAVAALSYLEGIPLKTFIVRKVAKGHGMQKQIEGPALQAKSRVILVDDVATTGKSLIEAKHALAAIGIEAQDAIVIVDRNEGASQNLKDAGITLTSIFNIEELAS
ncbi:MAG: orotate phosphoribosyltransferase [Candidatus Omnitrophota bacterium]|jgi:orotate phosphoribosyltransferase|nr:MAG: orotate phosphoribosyltransferase [Candidatus Omnitrophota bacterium]